MRKQLFAVIILGIGLSCSVVGSSEEKPTKITEKLSADEIAIYKSVIQQYTSDDRNNAATLNVSASTFPLAPDSPMNRLLGNECLKGIQLENLATASHSFHDLTPEILPSKNARLVNPNVQRRTVRDNDPEKTMREGQSVNDAVGNAFAKALFSMSEIAFDKERNHAVVSYSFVCGSLCGNGGTWVFEKIGNEWKKTDRNCGGWVS